MKTEMKTYTEIGFIEHLLNQFYKNIEHSSLLKLNEIKWHGSGYSVNYISRLETEELGVIFDSECGMTMTEVFVTNLLNK